MTLVRTPTIALVGNPNTGKTTLFNALAGMRQRVGNYPGVTVEIKKGKLRHGDQTFEIIDLPGTYSLAPRSPDELLAVELVLGRRPGDSRPDAVVTIVDASNLDRNLFLTTQVMELGVPVIVALNMMDVAAAQGLAIDVERLSRNLGVPVAPLQANKGKGIEELKEAISQTLENPVSPPTGPEFPEAFEREVAGLCAILGDDVSPFLVRRLLLDVGGQMERFLGERSGARVQDHVRAARKRLNEAGCPVPGIEARIRYGWIRRATADCLRRPQVRPVAWTDRLDRILTHKVWGSAVFLAIMFIVFEAIFFWARPLMDLIGAGQGSVGAWIEDSMTAGPLRSLLANGVIRGVGNVLAFVPQILILFAFIAILEDCGYMARAAYLMDRIMARCGLNGKSFIPLLSSVACAVPGIMAARVIENRRDRLATILVAPLMSCSARLPVYLLLVGAFLSPEHGFPVWVPGLTLFGMYAIGFILAPLIALCLKRSLLRGETPVFVMEMPLYKVPSVRLVLHRALESGWMFVRRAGTIILATMILVWALLYFPANGPSGSYEAQIEALNVRINALESSGATDKATLVELKQSIKRTRSEWLGRSCLGRIGKALEPAVTPLGWDWRIGMSALASFPAREVMVGTLGLVFSQGSGDSQDAEFRAELGHTLRQAVRESAPSEPLFTVPVALSVMVFFALCCQCASTLAVIRRETNSWIWPGFTFTYMTALAYLGAWATYQVGTLLGG
ncbi:MAG: ferrous iron transport protein B [Planctomycetes bacterium]|nr:ferrous iron transport protein B [Planctomycetota bacterium]